jgi:hypothetical protein
MVAKVSRAQVTQEVDALRWAVSGDDAVAAQETRRRARQCGPDAVAFLNFVMRTDNFASVPQRTRAASIILEVGEFLSSEAKPTGLFGGDPGDADGGANGATS